MLTTLFSSRVRAKVLSAFFLSPGEGLNASELARRLGESYSAVWKELRRLESLGILISKLHGSSKEYLVDETCPIAPELRSIVLKTEGVGRVVKTRLMKMDGVEEAFIYGSYAAGEAGSHSDIDLMIIGDVELSRLAPANSALELELNRPINYVIYSQAEWSQKAAIQDPFWENVMQSPKIKLIGGDHGL